MGELGFGGRWVGVGQGRDRIVRMTWRSMDSGWGAGPGERQATKPSGRMRTVPPRVMPWDLAQSVPSASAGVRSASGPAPRR